MADYHKQGKLRFWCQMVLPLVYDDSLSYMELLNKVVTYLNNCIQDVGNCETNIESLLEAFVNLQDYINEITEDITPLIEEKIDEMIESGEFGEILADALATVVAPEYDSSESYIPLNYVIYDGTLYCCTSNTTGTWDSTKWRETTVGDELNTLMQRVYSLNAGDVTYNSSETYDNGTVGKELNNLNNEIGSAISRNNSSYVGGASVTITGDSQTHTTDIELVSGKQYLIIRKTDLNNTNYIRCFSGSISSNYADLNAPKYFTTYTPNASGKLTLYSRGSYSNYNLELAVFEYDNPDVVLHDEIYVVDKSGYYNGSYTSLTQCFIDLKDNTNNKTVFVIGGDYDIYQEYVDANVPVYTGSNPMSDYFDYNVWIPINTHVIGLGLVRLKWQPTTSQASYNQSRTVSPVNVAGSMTLENVEIYCKNGRYCIHDDANGNFKYNRSIKRYINVKCYKLPNDSNYGTIHTIGMGIDREQYYVFEHCLFNNTVAGNSFYAHSRQTVGDALTEINSSNLLMDDCIFNSNGTPCVRFANSSNVTDQLIRVNIDNCTFTQAMHLESTPNKFLVTMNNSGMPTITIDDSSNIYEPIVFNSTFAGGRTKNEFKESINLLPEFAITELPVIGTYTGDGHNDYYIPTNYRGVLFLIGGKDSGTHYDQSKIFFIGTNSRGEVDYNTVHANDQSTTYTLSSNGNNEISITSTITANANIYALTFAGRQPYRKET